MAFSVGIIIVNWNGYDDTVACLQSLKGLHGISYAVYLVDNGSPHGDAARLDGYLASEEGVALGYQVSLLATGENLGFAGGNNRGLAQAFADGCVYALLLNNDTLVSPDFLSRLVDTAAHDARIGIAGPLILFAEQDGSGAWHKGERVWFGGGKIDWLRVRGTHSHYNEPASLVGEAVQDTAYITGCCLLVPRRAWERIGPLTEDYFLYYEDTEWCLRVKEAGLRVVFVPRSRIWHKVSRSAGEGSASYVYYHVRNALRMAWQHGDTARRAALVMFGAWLAAKQCIKLLLPAKRAWARAALAGLMDALRGRGGIAPRSL